MKVLITSGGTKVKIDMVRHIANMSSGTFGSKIATESLLAGHNVLFFKAKGSKTPFKISLDYFNPDKEKMEVKVKEIENLYINHLKNYKEAEYEYFEDYNDKIDKLILLYKPDVIVLAAAVSDYGVENYVDGKIRTKGDMSIHLKPYPKIISRIKSLSPTSKLIGFKLLVNSTEGELLQAAKDSVTNNGCDLVVANDLRDIKNSDHTIHLVTKDNVIKYETNFYDPNYLARKVVEKYNEL